MCVTLNLSSFHFALLTHFRLAARVHNNGAWTPRGPITQAKTRILPTIVIQREFIVCLIYFPVGATFPTRVTRVFCVLSVAFPVSVTEAIAVFVRHAAFRVVKFRAAGVFHVVYDT